MSAQIAHTPEDIPRLFCAAWNRYDARALADLFTEDADIVNVTGKWWENREDIYAAHDFGLRIIFKDSQLHIVRIQTKELAPKVAIVHAQLRLTGQTSQQDIDAHPRETIFTFVVQQCDAGWRCVAAHNTDMVVGKQTNFRTADGELVSVNYKEHVRLKP